MACDFHYNCICHGVYRDTAISVWQSAKAATVVQDNENDSEGMQTGLKVALGKANNRIVKTVFSGKSIVRNLTLGYVSGQSVIAYETAEGKISYTLPSSLSYKE